MSGVMGKPGLVPFRGDPGPSPGRAIVSLYAAEKFGLYAIARDGTAWRWSGTETKTAQWQQVVPLPEPPAPPEDRGS